MTTKQSTEQQSVHEVYATTEEKIETGSSETFVQHEITIGVNEKPVTMMGQEFDENGIELNYSQSKTEARLVRKLDWIYVMPFIAILNFLQVNLFWFLNSRKMVNFFFFFSIVF